MRESLGKQELMKSVVDKYAVPVTQLNQVFSQTISCTKCSVEVCNLLLVPRTGKNTITEVYCLQCAQRQSSKLRNFDCLVLTPLEELQQRLCEFEARIGHLEAEQAAAPL